MQNDVDGSDIHFARATLRFFGVQAALASLLLCGASDAALAQSASPGAAITLAPVTVEAPRRASAAPSRA